MKKFKIFLAVFTATIFFSVANAGLAATFERNLSYGMANDSDVKELQYFLRDQGYFNGPFTGNFYDLTCTAVREFQGANGIEPTCNFGPLTRAAANKVLSGGVSVLPKITIVSPLRTNLRYGETYPIEYYAEGVQKLGVEVLNGSEVVYKTAAPIPAGNPIGLDVNRYYLETGVSYSVRLFDWDNSNFYAESSNLISVGGAGLNIAGSPAPAPAPVISTPSIPTPTTSNLAEVSRALQSLLENLQKSLEALKR